MVQSSILSKFFVIAFSALALAGSSLSQSPTPKKTDLYEALMSLQAPTSPAIARDNAAVLEQAINLASAKDPWLSKAYYEMGTQLVSGDDRRHAIQAFRACRALPESVPGVRYAATQSLMLSLRLTGQTQEAYKLADEVSKTTAKGAQMAPTLAPKALLLKAEWQQESGQSGIKAATNTLEEFLKLSSKHGLVWKELQPHAYRALAADYESIGDLKRAISTVDRFLVSYPKHRDSAYMALLRERWKGGGIDQVPTAAYLKIRKTYPMDSGSALVVLNDLAVRLVQADQLRQALDVLTEAEAISTKLGNSDLDHSPGDRAEILMLLDRMQMALHLERTSRPLMSNLVKSNPMMPDRDRLEEQLNSNEKTDWSMLGQEVILVLLSVGAVIAVGIRFRSRRSV